MTDVTFRVLRSFGFAWAGLSHLARSQPNFWVHLIVAALVLIVAGLLEVRGGELAALILAIGLVLASEAGNTAVEVLVDLVSPGHDSRAGLAKDLGAAAVLLASVTAAAVGMIILLPPLLRRWG